MGESSRVRKKEDLGPAQMSAFRTLGKRSLLSLTCLPPGETRVREQAAEILFFRSLLAPQRRPSAPQALRCSACLAVALLAMLSPANCAENGPASGSVTMSGPHLAGAEGTSPPTPGKPSGPAAVNPLSERAQRIKKGRATPLAPGANPVPGGAPQPERPGPGPSGKFNSDHPPGSGDASAMHPVLEADPGPLFLNAQFSRDADWQRNEPFHSDE